MFILLPHRILRYLLPLIFFCYCLSLQAEPLLEDPAWHDGVRVMSNVRDLYSDHPHDIGVLQLPESAHKPKWQLNQWGNQFSVDPARFTAVDHAGRQWAANKTSADGSVHTFQALTLYSDTGSDASDADVQLELNGLSEFSERQTTAPQSPLYLPSDKAIWPHFLVTQQIQSKRLSAYESLRLQLDVRLVAHEKNEREGYRAEQHAGRFVIALAVRNTFTGHAAWLMLPLFDDRYASSPLGCQKCDDAGNCHIPQQPNEPGRWSCPLDGDHANNQGGRRPTMKMLFRVPTAAMTTQDIRSGEWTHIDVDVLPWIEQLIAAARETENAGTFSPSLRHYRLGLFSIGWEITGLNHGVMQVRHLSLEGAQ